MNRFSADFKFYMNQLSDNGVMYSILNRRHARIVAFLFLTCHPFSDFGALERDETQPKVWEGTLALPLASTRLRGTFLPPEEMGRRISHPPGLEDKQKGLHKL